MKKNDPIGVFDSGIGGLSVLKQFIRFLPHESYIYLGDTGRVPYGNKSSETVQSYSRECANFLIQKDVKLIVVACNTASSLALDAVREVSPVPVIGMIYPAASASLRATLNGKIGVIGTRATIGSNAYSNTIYDLADSDKIQVISKECPLFVPIVEEGWIRHNASKLIADEYLEIMKKEKIDTLVLGCTHYPLLSQLISETLPGVNLIDSGEHAAVNAIRTLAEKNFLVDEVEVFVKAPKIKFFVTDIPATFFEVAKNFLGFSVDSPQKVEL